MWNKILLSFILFLISSFSIFGEDYLEWKPVPEAGGYLVEIKDSGGRITREKTKSTRFEVNLPPGVYEHRIGVLNKFGRVSVFTDWISFEVILSRAPFINPDSSAKLLKEKLGSHLTVKGDNFTEAMNVTLLLPSGETIKPDFEFVNSKEIKLKIENLNLKNGSYTLSLENPRNKKTAKKGFLILADSEEELAQITKRSEQENQVTSSGIQWGPAIQSSVLPGWGQYNQDKKYKRWIFPILILGAIAFSAERFSAYNSSLSALNQSKTLNQTFFLMNDPALTSFAAYNYIQGQSDYSNSSSLYNQLNLSLEIIAVLYLLNIIDAALVGSANSETSTSEGKVIPFFKTRKLESIQAERPSGNFFPNSFEFGIKIFL
ncbi:hypothetical protein GS518_07160 [Leptospira interrogans]|uniref:DUF5683 domain-containing protein n=6 Tax=Leptospira interrogans TaxID=173 RepID=Q8F373_LEPIN|nr:DUF5683 domain-containing protein [Leptospira interrogans]APH41328.1 Uncharacterized protein A9P81_1537 [Leptospira interrogans serovar Copenhageni/Icterohaemorrhagiae]AAN49737.1 hypothetical protein LA_2538 [Leptospira interrogans serovar Lai str. 56601]AAS70034.1 conserved hypothetical protein [Leptospira interrogans serovar Copenhageni str. Fiocruz L1-130]AER02869.1 hypothetical protein LIF_A2076 [Leptospira interrogans serovar Lai str. IPAV]ARB97379.1 hypothetical protein A6J42_19660 [L